MNLLEAARSLAPTIRGRADEIEHARSLPPDLARELASRGLFRTLLPRRIGGLECDPLTALGTMERLGEADASVGWCTMIGATAGFSAAWLPTEVARDIHSDPLTVTGGVFAPVGRARADGTDYVVDGRWPWFSGHGHCRWLAGGCVVLDGDEPRRSNDGQVETRMVFFPAEAGRRLDGWHVSGLSGTGSGEVEVAGLRVPREQSISLTADPPREDGPLYRMPPFGLLAQGIAWVMLGNARAAIDELVDLAGGKRPQGSRRTLAERASAQLELARTDAALRAARAACVDAVAAAWRRAEAGDPPSLAERAALRQSATWATRTAADASRAMYDLGGGSSVYLGCPLQRRFRDAHVGTQHAMVGTATLELAGRVLMGLETDVALL